LLLGSAISWSVVYNDTAPISAVLTSGANVMQEEFAMPPEMNEHVPQSRFMWMISSLGVNTAFLPLAALVAFAVVLVLILRGKGPEMVGAILLVVPLPMYVGLWGAVGAIVASGAVIALADVDVKQSELWGGISEMFVNIQVAMLLTVPAFLLATIGLVIRALKGEPPHFQTALAAKVLP
jgi:hypothetical protein